MIGFKKIVLIALILALNVIISKLALLAMKCILFNQMEHASKNVLMAKRLGIGKPSNANR